jgi:hypothetical protein
VPPAETFMLVWEAEICGAACVVGWSEEGVPPVQPTTDANNPEQQIAISQTSMRFPISNLPENTLARPCSVRAPTPGHLRANKPI